ncbi:MAG TPA: histidine kinase dimerization/phospho-acceptor domain-containing protein, partial [Ktedonobacteraceae bacterium]|nr:histidine kinase dimerization/phospho-acceptor domain-containing protein [Ktedonobacteraceae bacterium]
MTKRSYKHPQGASTSVEAPLAPSSQQVHTEFSSHIEEQETVLTPHIGSHPILEAAVAHTPDAMIALNQDFRIIDLNPAASKLLECPTEKAIGHLCTELLHCQNLNQMKLCGTSSCPLVRVQQLKQPLPNEELVLGDSREVSASITPVDKGNGKLHVIFTACDLSPLKVANRVRANFVSMVSHELRTPLNSVHGFIDLLLQGHMGGLTHEQQKYLGYTQEGVEQLISIVEDILFMTRSDVGQFEIKQQEVNFRVLAKQVVGSL